MFKIFAHNNDRLRLIACADDFSNAVDQAISALIDWMAYSEVRRGDDETLWDSRYGYCD